MATGQACFWQMCMEEGVMSEMHGQASWFNKNYTGV